MGVLGPAQTNPSDDRRACDQMARNSRGRLSYIQEWEFGVMQDPSRDKSLGEYLFPDRQATFREVVKQLSAAETGPPADNMMTNEDSFTRVAVRLAGRAPQHTVYLGVGPDQNFSLIAHARPDLAFVIDYRRRNVLLHLLHKALFALSEDRQAYLSRLTARQVVGRPADLADAFAAVPLDRAKLDATIGEVADQLRSLDLLTPTDLSEIATMQARLAGPGVEYRFLALKIYPTLKTLMSMPGHMLWEEALYQRVRSLQKADRVLPIVADFSDSQAFSRLGPWLTKHGLSVGVIYVSDVEFFLLRSAKWQSYIENLGRIAWHPEALIVRTSTREIDHPQRVRGDSSTTTVGSMAEFLSAARMGKIRSVDDLFHTPGG